MEPADDVRYVGQHGSRVVVGEFDLVAGWVQRGDESRDGNGVELHCIGKFVDDAICDDDVRCGGEAEDIPIGVVGSECELRIRCGRSAGEIGGGLDGDDVRV